MQLLFILTILFLTILLSIMYSKEYTLVFLGTIALMMFHQKLTFRIDLLPDLGPYTTVIVGLSITSFLYILKKWQFSSTDIFIVTFGILMVFSQYQSAYSVYTKGALRDFILSILLPYILFKSLLDKGKFSILFLKLVVYCTVVIVILGVWEMRMTQNLFKEVALLINSQANLGKAMYRFGLVRLNGPFGGPLTAGLMLGFAFQLNLILSKSKLWNKRFRVFPIPISKPLLFSIILGIGVCMPMSRIALFALFLSIIFYHTISRRLLDPITFTFISVFLVLTGSGYIYYKSTVSAPESISESGITVSTRAREKKMDELIPVIKKNLLFGVGKKGNLGEKRDRPTDNHYLHLAHLRGVPAMTIFLLIGVTQLYRLVKRGKRVKKQYPVDATFAFGYATIIFFLYICFTQVVLFRSLGLLFFGLVGLFEAHIIAKDGYLDNSPYVIKLLKKKQKKAALSRQTPIATH